MIPNFIYAWKRAGRCTQHELLASVHMPGLSGGLQLLEENTASVVCGEGREYEILDRVVRRFGNRLVGDCSPSTKEHGCYDDAIA